MWRPKQKYQQKFGLLTFLVLQILWKILYSNNCVETAVILTNLVNDISKNNSFPLSQISLMAIDRLSRHIFFMSLNSLNVGIYVLISVMIWTPSSLGFNVLSLRLTIRLKHESFYHLKGHRLFLATFKKFL